ncbi:protein trichome birefringence-like 24 isoform X2 [Primulina eburnea]|uniref:protein trichome birefringence-like 24 isoform X2 n=1 Tax=Primulina eburnea TaxID=1245227 RepID=UPI003C6C0EF8
MRLCKAPLYLGPRGEKRMKQLSYNVYRNPFSPVLVKLGVCFLLLGLSYRLFSSNFVLFSPSVVDDNELGLIADDNFSSHVAEPPENTDDLLVDLDNHSSQNESCDLFIGDWVPDPKGPIYTNTTCYSMESPQNCMNNGRPDSDYLYWRWNPRNCSLPKFDPKKFLHIMRHKSLAFIGDSIMRNHVQSLLCVLSQTKQSVEVYHDSTFKNRRWLFPSHNFTVSVVWSPFLAKAVTFEDDNGVSSGMIQLHLDELDTVWTQQYHNFDHIIIAGGKWYLKSAIYYENKTVVGCHNCHDQNITQLGFKYAYRKVLNSTFKFITGSNHKPYIFVRTITPDHFENGEWSSGGYCNRTRPFKEGDIEISDIDEILRNIELEEFKSAETIGSENGTILKLFDTMFLSLLRPDGHPGVYRQFHPYAGKDKNSKIQNDCLHWCLPGPIDSWNDLMMEMLLRRSS